MELTVNTEQIAALRDFFDGLSAADQRKIFLAAFRRASKPMVDEAKATVPRRTGNLQRSIGTIALSGEAALLMGARKGGGYKGWHGHLIENGTVERFRKKKKNAPTGKVIGTAFLEQAYMQNEQYLIDATESEWLRSIDLMIVRVNKRSK